MKKLLLTLILLALAAGGVQAQIFNPQDTSGFVNTAADQYPVFLLPLDGWSDFELKASTNNIASAEGLVYWVDSSTTNDDGAAWSDPLVRVFYTDTGSGDPRVWRQAANLASIGSQLSDTGAVVEAALVFPSKLANAAAWCVPSNTALRWSWLRKTPAAKEEDYAGRQRWQPAYPLDWRKERP